MFIKLQIFLFIFSILILLVIINMIRKYSLELKYSLLWLCLFIIVTILVIFPDLLNIISDYLQFETPSNALFLFGIAACLLILFSLTVAVSRNSNKMKNIAQELGILKQRMDEMKDLLEKQTSEK